MASRMKLLHFLFLAFFFVFATNLPVINAGSFFDTLNKADEGTANDQRVEPSFSNQSCPQSGAQSGYSKPAQLPKNPPPNRMTSDKLEALIRNIIQQILSKFGLGGLGGKIIIIRFPPVYPPPQQPPPKPPAPPATYTPNIPPTQPPNYPPATYPVSGIAGLKGEMKAKFGITASDGDGAEWSQRQLEEANKVLATLPESFRSSTKTIQRDAIYRSPGVLGYVRMGIPTVHLLNSSTRQGTFQGTLVHEMTHTWQAEHMNVTNQWERTFWPQGKFGGARPPSVSQYGNSQPLEDMAESVRQYWQAGSQMRRTHPDRYEFIKKYVMQGKEF
ncbi:hypothetical protein HYY75_12230 [bacterium]|nr:hypothetical protein [bacterium]